MQIIIKDFNGFRTSIEVNPSETIEQIKLKIQKYLTIPKEAQDLFLNNLLLENNKKLSEYNINEGLDFELSLKEGFVKINAVNIMGKRMNFYFKKTDSILNIKKKIEEKEGIPLDVQKLILEPRTINKELENSKIIQDYNIRDNSNIHIFYNK